MNLDAKDLYRRARNLLQDGEDETAIHLLRAAITLNPDHDMSHIELGLLLAKQGDCCDAVKLFEKVYRSDLVKGWGKFGLVIQTYSKRALPVLVWINALAKEQGDQIPLRLVKGAYWDSEIKMVAASRLRQLPSIYS